jgi:hypothetical protein
LHDGARAPSNTKKVHPKITGGIATRIRVADCVWTVHVLESLASSRANKILPRDLVKLTEAPAVR